MATLVEGETATLGEAAWAVEEVDQALRGVPGVMALLSSPTLADQLDHRLATLEKEVARLGAVLDADVHLRDPRWVEECNVTLLRLKDATWAVRHDRMGTAEGVAALAGEHRAGEPPRPPAVEAYTSIQCVLSALDRLEVRGRDSAGLHVLVEGHRLDVADPEIVALLANRAQDRLFTSMAVRESEGQLAFVYKAAAEIGELGDNVAALRRAIAGDELLRLAVQAPQAQAVVLAHTRWASVGIISQANAHPLNSDEETRPQGPYVVAALNGDVDNHAELVATADLQLAPEITTDAKVIPALVSRRMLDGCDASEAFRATVATLEGSVAVAANTASGPDRLLLAVRGSGQALYLGLAEDAFVVASEPYGLVQETSRYVRMDGESGHRAGQMTVLDRSQAGTIDGIARSAYAGTALPVEPREVRTAEVTTRDIDRAGHPHYLLKEVLEAPTSWRKTLRGKVVEEGGHLRPQLGRDTLAEGLRLRLAAGSITRVVSIGQGTAAVSAQSLAAALRGLLRTPIPAVEATTATELSGFGLVDDMADTLVIAVSQSGTTTDTNRTVDLVRARGASVVSIVNRRNSDLVEKSDGVLYTSDGRDVEMAVPSTKAFYAQVAAGFLLATALAELLQGQARQDQGRPGPDRHRVSEILRGLRALPDAMDALLAERARIADVARRHAPGRRNWALVGNGPNAIAAHELRIKLSELCYKSIACDVTEDKKHVDLSSEPLVLVCAAGLSGPNAADVAKEVAIYRAHKAIPVVIATHGEDRFTSAADVIRVPPVDPALGFVLSAMAGHLFGYEAALAIDAQAVPLREMRAAIETTVSNPDRLDPLERLQPLLREPSGRFLASLRAGQYNATLDASTAVQVSALLRCAAATSPLDDYELEVTRLDSPAVAGLPPTVVTPAALIEDLTVALTRAIEELTRPIDAIKHQAKTVTVGISRSEEALYASRLVRAVLDAGVPRSTVGYRALRSLAGLEPAVKAVTGSTSYRIDNRVADDEATIAVVAKLGVASQIPSRADPGPVPLRGTKHRATSLREVLVATGHDGRSVILVPEVRAGQVAGIVLLHVELARRLPAEAAHTMLASYLDRLDAVVDAVTETEPVFDEAVLADVEVIDLLTQPVRLLAERWRSSSR